MLKLKNHRGATLLEMAIALPVLLILLIGVVDLSLAIEKYSALSRATYEAIRYGAKLPNLEKSCIANYQGACSELEDGASDQEKKMFQDNQAILETINYKVTQILEASGYKLEEDDLKVKIDVEKKTQVDRNPGYNENYSYKQIRTTLKLRNKAIFPLFDLIPIQTSITFSDLYKDRRLVTGIDPNKK